uniref:hypothetical protein n=1 Tax=Pedobacter schmidteae TaxID=2201271 RepID=UPI000EB2B5C8|nr:hypothetical protein [Pedobacter schmidteae]
MERNILTTFLIFATSIAAAQQPVIVSIGGGVNNSSSSLKTKAYLGNGQDVHANVFVPFLRKGWDGSVKGSGKFALGIVAGGAYQTVKSLTPDAGTTQAAYQLYSGNLEIANAQKGATANKGFMGSAGLQADFTLGSLTLSPSISGGYMSLKQDGFLQSSSVMVNGATQTIVLSESPEVRSTGFIAMPQLKISYPLSDALSIYAAGSLNLGPEIKTMQSWLKPAGGFNDKNTYEPGQLSSGKMIDQSGSVTYQSMVVNAGLSWNFGSKTRRLKGKVTKPGDNGMVHTAAVSSIGNGTGGSGAASASYAAGRVVAPTVPNEKSIDKKGVKSINGKQAEALVAGTPIGGIVVKGGKNPGGNLMVITTNDKGELVLNDLEAGNYTFTITPQDEPQGRSISEKGVSSTKSRPVKAQALVAGNPIGGIIVKGGKNPGGNFIVTATNDKGEFSFQVSETGNYLFKVTTPEPGTKSINEKGVK